MNQVNVGVDTVVLFHLREDDLIDLVVTNKMITLMFRFILFCFVGARILFVLFHFFRQSKSQNKLIMSTGNQPALLY
jgi:prolipoprotein diacylglyceryltransferase